MSTIQHDIDVILKTAPDPLEVRATTALVVKNSRFVSINQSNLKKFSQVLKKRIKRGKLLTKSQFGHSPLSPQLIFIQDAINFCFWAKKGQKKWSVEYPKGKIQDGLYALIACFDRAIAEGIPLLDSTFLDLITEVDVKHILRSCNKTKISLLQKRVTNLRESGRILNQHFDGRFENLIKQADYDAPKVAKAIITHFTSFNDSALFQGKTINFQKRAQLCAYDLSLLPKFHITKTDYLTAFADYKLPQILRSYGVLQYTRPLAKKVDAKELIEKGSREEIEIRASTIWACELMAKEIHTSPPTVDNAIWVIAQEKKRSMHPYHRTVTTSY